MQGYVNGLPFQVDSRPFFFQVGQGQGPVGLEDRNYPGAGHLEHVVWKPIVTNPEWVV